MAMYDDERVDGLDDLDDLDGGRKSKNKKMDRKGKSKQKALKFKREQDFVDSKPTRPRHRKDKWTVVDDSE